MEREVNFTIKKIDNGYVLEVDYFSINKFYRIGDEELLKETISKLVDKCLKLIKKY
ncbi:MAG: hypothetical protein OH319_05170 [Candidatus Parvarchaeota archaeon]|nr:hypothetical protein [Candidatus Jingweiarchaeum tengchongense]